MDAIFEDLYDWEALELRFVPRDSCSHDSAQALAEFIPKWMQQQVKQCPDDWSQAELFSVAVEKDRSVVALFNLPPEYMCRQLAQAVGVQFPDYLELRIGVPITPCSTALVSDWFQLPGGTVETPFGEVEVGPTAITSNFVSSKEYEQFTKETNYVPIPDRLEEDPNYVIGTSIGTWGAKGPVFQVTQRDADAYCRWAGCRLPTAAELIHFFQSIEAEGIRPDWAFPCWTATPFGREQFVTVAWGSDVDALHRDHYQWAEAPSFRMAADPDTIPSK